MHVVIHLSRFPSGVVCRVPREVRLGPRPNTRHITSNYSVNVCRKLTVFKFLTIINLTDFYTPTFNTL